MIQGSEEWLDARRGKCTASRIADMMARTKTEWGASRENYKAELVLERITGKTQEHFQSQAMKDGTATEPEARTAYEFEHDVEVQQVGFIHHPTIVMAGASPDGLVGDKGLVEIKCPLPATHLKLIERGELDSTYIKQMMFQLACSPGREWCDRVSYCPAFPEEMRLIVYRAHRDNALIQQIEREVVAFLAEVDDAVQFLRRRFQAERAA